MREVYADRRAVLVDATRSELGELLVLSPVDAGLQTSGLLGRGFRSRDVVRAAACRGVEVAPLAEFRRAFRGQGLQLGFAAVAPEEIRRGVRELGSVLRELTGVRRVTRAGLAARA